MTSSSARSRLRKGKAVGAKKRTGLAARADTTKHYPPETISSGPALRPGSKTGKILALLRRPQGASLGELVRVTNWLENSVRGALSGTIRKKLGLTLRSQKSEKIRRYKIVETQDGSPQRGLVS
jgi:hypothetical protein